MKTGTGVSGRDVRLISPVMCREECGWIRGAGTQSFCQGCPRGFLSKFCCCVQRLLERVSRGVLVCCRVFRWREEVGARRVRAGPATLKHVMS